MVKYGSNILLLIMIITIEMAVGQVSIGADIVSRYIWRGTDFGNAAAVQPGIETSLGSITLGAWGSWAFNGASDGNECDLYASTQVGPINITLTDFFFPSYSEDGFFKFDGKNADDAKHIIELSAASEVSSFSLLVGINVYGDYDDMGTNEDLLDDKVRNSTYLELSYNAFTIGLGNGVYSTDGEFAPVSLGVTANRDNFSASYIINPDQETSFLIFGVNF